MIQVTAQARTGSADRREIMSETAPLQTPDVLVVGGGSAALCAAIAARRSGASVRLVEHAPATLARRQHPSRT